MALFPSMWRGSLSAARYRAATFHAVAAICVRGLCCLFFPPFSVVLLKFSLLAQDDPCLSLEFILHFFVRV